MFTDLGLNVRSVDTRPQGSRVTFDLLGDFGASKNFGVEGRVLVELKDNPRLCLVLQLEPATRSNYLQNKKL